MTRKMLTLRLPDDLTDTLKKNADASSITITEYVTRLLRQGLDGNTTEVVEKVETLESQLGALQKLTYNIKDDLIRLQGNMEGRVESLQGVITNLCRSDKFSAKL